MMLGFGKSKGPQPPRWYAPAQMAMLDLAQYDRDMAHYAADTLPQEAWEAASTMRLRVELDLLGGPQDGAGEAGGCVG